jgi:hypothetical protein
MVEQLLLFASLGLGAIGFDDAKALADKQEATLSPAQTERFQALELEFMTPVFRACTPSPRPERLPDFTLVMTLDANGKVQHTWLQGGGTFAKCVESKFAGAALFKPPSAPFYTSLEHIFEP